MEFLSYPGFAPEERAVVKRWLQGFIIDGSDAGIRSIAIDLRVRFRLKLADAFVAVTAAYLNIPLITEDKHFKKLKEEVDLWMV